MPGHVRPQYLAPRRHIRWPSQPPTAEDLADHRKTSAVAAISVVAIGTVLTALFAPMDIRLIATPAMAGFLAAAAWLSHLRTCAWADADWDALQQQD